MRLTLEKTIPVLEGSKDMFDGALSHRHRIGQTHVSQATNDMREMVPVLDKISALPDDLGQVSSMLADTGYCSAANVQSCETRQIEPMLAMKHQAAPCAAGGMKMGNGAEKGDCYRPTKAHIDLPRNPHESDNQNLLKPAIEKTRGSDINVCSDSSPTAS